MSLSKVHRTAAWRKLSKATILAQPICHLRLPGCTIRSTCTDHLIPVSLRPDLALDPSNCAGSCKSCNDRRGNTPMDMIPQLRTALTQSESTKHTEPQHNSQTLSFFKQPTANNHHHTDQRTGFF